MTGHVTKPGVDWATIRREYEAGTASARELSRKHFISHTAINKRAKREGWAEPGTVSIGNLEPLSTNGRPPTNTVEGKKARILESLSEGLTPRLAAMLVRVNPETYQAWLKADPDFAHDAAAAQIRWAKARLEDMNKASKRGDWRAGQALIERHPITAPEFGAKTNESSKIEIVFQGMPAPKAVTVIEHE